MLRIRRTAAAVVAAAALTGSGLAMATPAFAHTPGSFIGQFSKIKKIASTIPGNGDLNPYGVAVVQHSQGRLNRGDVLVSNFNNKANQQGTGSTIVEISPGGHRTVFAHITKAKLPGPCPGGVGLTTALDILPGGWVVVGSTPSTNGMAATAKAGCLIVLNNLGRVRETISGHGINGPWDMTALSFGEDGEGFAELFVTNVLNGTVKANGAVVHRGTVLRLIVRLSEHRAPRVLAVTKIGSGFFEKTDPTAFVIGPTGLGLGRDGTLNGPLGLAIAPNGDVLTVNGGDGLIVETTPRGHQIATFLLDSSGSPPGSGANFSLAVAPHGRGVYCVNDNTNMLDLLH